MNKQRLIQKVAIITALIAIMVITAWQPVAAQQKGGAAQAGANGDAFAAMCRAAGGTPVWTTSIDSGGYVTYIVECHGGYLGGLNCFFDEQFTSCTQTRKLPAVDLPPVEIEVIEIAPVDEPAQPQVIETVEVDPNRTADEPASDPTATATNESTLEPMASPTVEPNVDDGSVVIVEPGVLDGNDLPELQQVPVVPVIEPISPVEEISLP
jgi:hypothetical protein